MLDNNISIVNSDCFIYIKNIPDNFIHLIASDIPYGIGCRRKVLKTK